MKRYAKQMRPALIWLNCNQMQSHLYVKSLITENINTNRKNALLKPVKSKKIIEVKEIKLRPNIDSHDYDVKMRAVRKFLEAGDKVKVTLRFRGREMAHIELGSQLLERVRTDIDEEAKIEAMPKMEGRQMIMVLAPK